MAGVRTKATLGGFPITTSIDANGNPSFKAGNYSGYVAMDGNNVVVRMEYMLGAVKKNAVFDESGKPILPPGAAPQEQLNSLTPDVKALLESKPVIEWRLSQGKPPAIKWSKLDATFRGSVIEVTRDFASDLPIFHAKNPHSRELAMMGCVDIDADTNKLIVKLPPSGSRKIGLTFDESGELASLPTPPAGMDEWLKDFKPVVKALMKCAEVREWRENDAPFHSLKKRD